jgi:hypothetical protein
VQPSALDAIKTGAPLNFVGLAMRSVEPRRSPFFSTPFLRRLQKMIPAARGPATQIEQAIERALARLASIFTALGR